MAGNSATPSEGAKDGPVGFIAGRSTGFGRGASAAQGDRMPPLIWIPWPVMWPARSDAR